MNWTRRVAAFALLALLAQALIAAEKPLVIPDKDYFIGKITIGASQKEVQAAFGVPRKTQKIPSSWPCRDTLAEEYGGVQGVFCDGKLMKLACSKKGIKTPSGIEVGMTLKEVMRRQGNTIVRDVSGGQVLRYQAANGDKILLVHFEDGKVTKIELWFSQM